jgi:hypothetical protein
MRRKKSYRTENKLYLSVLDKAEALEFKNALAMDGLDAEIALLRVQIACLLSEADGPDRKELSLILSALARLISTRYNTTKDQKKGLKEAIGNVLRDIALPLGLKLGEKLIERKL